MKWKINERIFDSDAIESVTNRLPTEQFIDFVDMQERKCTDIVT